MYKPPHLLPKAAAAPTPAPKKNAEETEPPVVPRKIDKVKDLNNIIRSIQTAIMTESGKNERDIVEEFKKASRILDNAVHETLHPSIDTSNEELMAKRARSTEYRKSVLAVFGLEHPDEEKKKGEGKV